MTALVTHAPPPRLSPSTPLRRHRRATVAGVASGLAEHLGWRVGPTRALFVVAAAAMGAGVLFYVWLWAFVPLEESDQRITRRAPVAWVTLATALVLVLTLVSPIADSVGYGYVAPWAPAAILAAMVLSLTAGVWAAVLDRADPSHGEKHDLIVRALSTAVLVTLTVMALILGGGGYDLAVVAVLLALLGLLFIFLVWSPALITRYRELQTARVRAIRDEHRAEMAAHLHDSVLQTLALIQNRAGASSEAGRLARAQERELRAWLYDGDTPADSDLATDLRDYGSALELDYEVVMTVVSAGTSTERASGEVAAAAREAMLNAARHAGGEVSVYIEGAPGSVDVYVRDRGPGFVLAQVPSDRLGVRESIIGRLRRIGGSATVTPGAGGGTEVHIRFPAGGSRG